VGNTTKDDACAANLAVHPHGRGEYRMFHMHDPPLDGSPPRAWGIP